MARTVLRMMPTFPLPPLKSSGRRVFPGTVQGRNFRCGLPSGLVCLRRSLLAIRYSRLSVRADALMNTSVRTDLPFYPRGLAPVRAMLSRSIHTYPAPSAPLAGAHPDPAVSRFIPDALAVHTSICLGDPRLVLSFDRCSFATCRPLRPRGTFRLLLQSASPRALAFNSRFRRSRHPTLRCS
jgi:hypothetical protein